MTITVNSLFYSLKRQLVTESRTETHETTNHVQPHTTKPKSTT